MKNYMFIPAKGLIGIILVFVFCNLQAQDRINASAVAKEVTIFSYGAEIMNRVPVNLPKGNAQLYIQNVARDIDVNTVQLSGPDGITVLSVSLGTHQDAVISNPVHRKLKDSLDLRVAQKDLLVTKQKAAQGALKILNNEQLLGGGSKVDIADLTKLVDYYQVKSVELNSLIASLTKSITTEEQAIRRLQEQIRSFIGNGAVLIVQMNNTKAIQGNLEVSYVTSSASWQAYYDLRAKSITAPLEILYKAKVMQSSGVDWKNVKLTLSTGNPIQNSNAPLLNPSYAQYYVANQGLNAFQGRIAGLQVQNKIQSMRASDEVVFTEAAIMPVAKPKTEIKENQLNASFDIEVPYDIISNGEPHVVTLKEYVQPATFKYYAVPKLEKDAFLLAEVNDFEKLNLVPGEANIIFENMYVGNSYINPSVTSDTLNLSMGRDKAITLKRERIMDVKSNQQSGSSKRQTYTYELRVRNGKSTAIDMLLKDQYPISTDKSIEIELTDNGGAMVNKETGILTWMINVKPGETKTYRFTFTVKSPKDKVVTFD